MIIIIACVAANRVIGANGTQPIFIKADLDRFRALTAGKPVVMGRKTMDAIIAKRGSPLPNRINIVVTRDPARSMPGVIFCNSVESAIETARKHGRDVYVIGGAAIYEAAMPLADRLELTEVDARPEGDVLFPPVDNGVWREVARVPMAEGELKYAFVTYER